MSCCSRLPRQTGCSEASSKKGQLQPSASELSRRSPSHPPSACLLADRHHLSPPVPAQSATLVGRPSAAIVPQSIATPATSRIYPNHLHPVGETQRPPLSTAQPSTAARRRSGHTDQHPVQPSTSACSGRSQLQTTPKSTTDCTEATRPHKRKQHVAAPTVIVGLVSSHDCRSEALNPSLHICGRYSNCLFLPRSIAIARSIHISDNTPSTS